MALGADMCNAARAMMFALGCIQALRCNTNQCPTGVATQDPELVRGLHVGDKSARVARYHAETVKSFFEVLGAAGFHEPCGSQAVVRDAPGDLGRRPELPRVVSGAGTRSAPAWHGQRQPGPRVGCRAG